MDDQSRNQPKSHTDCTNSGPSQHGTEQQPYQGNEYISVRVVEEIRVQAIPYLLAEYKAGQKEDSAHNAKTRLIGWLSFSVVVIYSSLALWQVLETRRSNQIAHEANALTIDSVRARVVISVPTFSNQLAAGSKMGIQMLIKNVGRSQGFYSIDFGSSRWAGMPNGNMPVSETVPNTSIDVDGGGPLFLYERQFLTQNYLDNIPTIQQVAQSFSDSTTPGVHSFTEISPSQLLTYFYGQINYDSIGPRRKKQFCFYVVKADFSLPEAPTNNGDRRYMLLMCPKWNTSDR